MKSSVQWTDGMAFQGQCDCNQVILDAKAPLGKGLGMTPKELVGVGLAGCTAMDVIALMKKHKQNVKSFRVDTDITQTTGGHPTVFASMNLTFTLEGEIDPEKALEAVRLSQTKYCGVSAMLAKSAPIQYKVILNGSEIGSGKADFQ